MAILICKIIAKWSALSGMMAASPPPLTPVDVGGRCAPDLSYISYTIFA